VSFRKRSRCRLESLCFAVELMIQFLYLRRPACQFTLLSYTVLTDIPPRQKNTRCGYFLFACQFGYPLLRLIPDRFDALTVGKVDRVGHV